MFIIDTDKYNVIDISYLVIPGENPDRPFEIRKGILADDSIKHDITNTHTHVGTHIEMGSHFYEGGRSVEAYELTRFFGRGVMVTIDLGEGSKHIPLDHVKDQIDSLLKEGDTVVFRNLREPKDPRTYFDLKNKKFISHPVAEYLRDRGIKMAVMGRNISVGADVEEGRGFHDILMGSGVLLLETVGNLFAVKKSEFFVMALPILVKGLDSSWARAVIIEDKD